MKLVQAIHELTPAVLGVGALAGCVAALPILFCWQIIASFGVINHVKTFTTFHERSCRVDASKASASFARIAGPPREARGLRTWRCSSWECRSAASQVRGGSRYWAPSLAQHAAPARSSGPPRAFISCMHPQPPRLPAHAHALCVEIPLLERVRRPGVCTDQSRRALGPPADLRSRRRRPHAHGRVAAGEAPPCVRRQDRVDCRSQPGHRSGGAHPPAPIALAASRRSTAHCSHRSMRTRSHAREGEDVCKPTRRLGKATTTRYRTPPCASSLQVAYTLAGLGARLVLSARRKDALEEVAKECRRLGAPDAQVVTMDLRGDSASLQARAWEGKWAHLNSFPARLSSRPSARQSPAAAPLPSPPPRSQAAAAAAEAAAAKWGSASAGVDFLYLIAGGTQRAAAEDTDPAVRAA